MNRSTVVLVACVVALAACTGDRTPAPVAEAGNPQTEQAPPPMPGSDQDAHGCKPSAGYTWCARRARCERPWELAAAQGLENSPQAFKDWCEAVVEAPSGKPAGD